jgi:inositol-phosphate phosphatase/L-galactose 1-phosphate phosphatase
LITPLTTIVEFLMDAIDIQQCLAVAKQAALAAGQIIKDSFDVDNKGIEQKSTHVDLVTETDKNCEDVIYQMLQQHFPTHQFIGEEQASANGGQPDLTNEPTWMVSRGSVDVIQGQSLLGGVAVSAHLPCGS